MAPFLNKLTRQIDRLQSQHHALTGRPWLAVPSGRVYLLLIILLSLAAAFANFHVRNQQFIHWESHPEKFFVGDTPLFSTMDAGYFLGVAQSLSRQMIFLHGAVFLMGKNMRNIMLTSPPPRHRCYPH